MKRRSMKRRARGGNRTGLVTLLVGGAATIAAVGCGGEAGTEDQVVATPAEGFAALEETLRAGGPPVRIAFDVTAEGAVSADLTGTLLLGRGGRARLEAAGDFAGTDLDVTLISDGDRMFRTGAEAGVDTPPALRDALAVGFTRMGILHNLARLSGGAPPDHAEGGVDEWVVVTPADRDAADGIPAAGDSTAVVFDITVAGQPAGSFALEMDGRVPEVRHQVVEFPQGIMRVTERYRVVELDADHAPGAFDTTPLDTSR